MSWNQPMSRFPNSVHERGSSSSNGAPESSMHPRTVEDVFMDFKKRRAGIIKALTCNVDEFYELCDPSYQVKSMFVWASIPTKQWQVNQPCPSDLPDPKIGINLMRDAMGRDNWLSTVALHSNAWLYAVASYYALNLRFDEYERKRLFDKIMRVPLLCEVITGEARRKARRESNGLPYEMLIEVLARLSVKDLLRYRSVSKMWRSLIDDPRFVLAHLKRSKINAEGNHLLVIERPRGWQKTDPVWTRHNSTFKRVAKLGCLDDSRNSCHLSYINGLMLVRNGSSKWLRAIILWNPSINRSLHIFDSIVQSMKDAAHFELGLGFDAASNDYKVIAIVYPEAECKYNFDRYRAKIPGSVQVYKLGTNSRSSHIGLNPPPYWTEGPQVFVEGAIHWTNLGPKDRDDSWSALRDSHIVAFDVANEVFDYLELPIDDGRGDQSINASLLTVFEGSLAVFCKCKSQNNIWVMKEYGVANSWSKCYTFMLHIHTAN